MSEEIEDVAPAVEPAPEQVETAAPESEGTQEPEATTPPKTFTQEELDAVVSKRLAREERKWAREQAEKAKVVPVEPPNIESFEDNEAYIEALAEHKAAQKLAEREASKQRSEVMESYQDKVEAAQEKYADFDQVAQNPNLPVTQIMAEAITNSDIGPDILYHLGMNPKEAARISALSPVLQAKEIGRVEAKLAESPPTKKTSNAPPPITPVTPKGGTPSYDTTDPRSIKAMSTSEWIAAERARQVKKWEAAR